MTISMYAASVPVFVKMLTNAKGWLMKAQAHAEAKKFDSGVLLNDRLAPDMLNFTKQIQIATDGAKGCGARLAGVDIPSFADNEATLPELVARLDKTIDFLNTLSAAQIDGTEDKDVVLKSAWGERHFKGQPYLLEYVVPNFYFHLTTAYAILRHNGVELGKGDFLPKA
jgi:hypothetical protein